jgi:uncharacterized membrane protein
MVQFVIVVPSNTASIDPGLCLGTSYIVTISLPVGNMLLEAVICTVAVVVVVFIVIFVYAACGSATPDAGTNATSIVTALA